jgi:excisionase family DNA binding protein
VGGRQAAYLRTTPAQVVTHDSSTSDSSTSAAAPATRADILTAREASEYLRVPQRSLYQYAARGELPSVKIGRHRRFRRSSIDRWLADREAVAS